MPGVNGKQAGLTFPDLQGKPAPTYAIGNDFQACGEKDPSHAWQSMVKQYNGGKCDGWLQTQTTGTPGLSWRTVIVVDEVAMVGTRKIARLYDHTHGADAKVVLVGDHHQVTN